MLADRVIRAKLPVVKLQRRKLHDLVVHAILDIQAPSDVLLVVFHGAFQQAHAESLLSGLRRDNRGRQLKMVAGQDDTLGTQ